MRLSLTYAYKMGAAGHDQPHVICVPDLTEARRQICAVIDEYKKELDEFANGTLEASPVSVRPEVINSVIVIDFGTYVEGQQNPVIVETTRRVDDVLRLLDCSS